MSASAAKVAEPSAISGEAVTLIQGQGQGMTAPKHGSISVLDTKVAEADKKQYTAYILQPPIRKKMSPSSNDTLSCTISTNC
jgi:hypothetical protein